MLFFLYFILLIVLVSLVLLVMSNISFLRTKVPFISLSSKRIDEILDQIELQKGKLLYDLGCGDGRFLVKAHKRYGVQGVGYEINFWAYLRARVKTYKYRNQIKIYYKNFLEENFKEADYIFIYLMPEVMEMVGQKLKKELKPSTLIISCAFHIPNIKANKVLTTSLNKKSKGKVFLYNLV